MSTSVVQADVWSTISPWLTKVAHLLRDDQISEIMINHDGRVYVERDGVLSLVEGILIGEQTRRTAAQQIAISVGQECDEDAPLLDASLPDGSRVSAVLRPISVGGTILTIRKFNQRVFTAEELCRLGMFSEATLEKLAGAIADRKTLLLSGIPGAGKTTLLNALAAYIPVEERIVLIEDTSEIALHGKHLVRLVTSIQPAVTIRDLLKKTLRLRPDRIIVGEVRGAEAFDLLMAMNSGALGTISTLHANSAANAIQKLRTYLAMSPDASRMSHRALGMFVGDHINVVIQTERRGGVRRVSQVCDVDGYAAGRDMYVLKEWEL